MNSYFMRLKLDGGKSLNEENDNKMSRKIRFRIFLPFVLNIIGGKIIYPRF